MKFVLSTIFLVCAVSCGHGLDLSTSVLVSLEKTESNLHNFIESYSNIREIYQGQLNDIATESSEKLLEAIDNKSLGNLVNNTEGIPDDCFEVVLPSAESLKFCYGFVNENLLQESRDQEILRSAHLLLEKVENIKNKHAVCSESSAVARYYCLVSLASQIKYINLINIPRLRSNGEEVLSRFGRIAMGKKFEDLKARCDYVYIAKYSEALQEIVTCAENERNRTLLATSTTGLPTSEQQSESLGSSTTETPEISVSPVSTMQTTMEQPMTTSTHKPEFDSYSTTAMPKMVAVNTEVPTTQEPLTTLEETVSTTVASTENYVTEEMTSTTTLESEISDSTSESTQDLEFIGTTTIANEEATTESEIYESQTSDVVFSTESTMTTTENDNVTVDI